MAYLVVGVGVEQSLLVAQLASPLLALRTLAVSGTSVLTPEQVTTAAAAPLGRPLPRVDERTVAERVAALPQVESVTVRRHLPHTLDVLVTERRPAYAVAVGPRWLVVDPTGIAYLDVAEAPQGLVRVTAPVDDPVLLQGLARVTAALPPELRQGLEGIEAKSADTVTLKLAGRQVVLGSTADLEVKLQVAQVLLRDTRATWINVSAPGHPATR